MSRSGRRSLPFLTLAAALLAFAPAAARAGYVSGNPDSRVSTTSSAGMTFSLGASLGVVEGTASEFAFYYPYGKKFKLSELTWDIKDVAMGGLHGTVGFGRRVRLNFGAWSALSEGSGRMIDRDWDYPDSYTLFLEPNGGNWTHESRHPDTSLDKAIIFDQSLSVLALQLGSFSLSGLVGYKHDTWRWSARGGTYTYSLYGFRDLSGSIAPGKQVIVYEQQYSIPYVGVSAGWARPAFQMQAHVLYGPAVTASDSDYHVLRDLLFEGHFSGGSYLGLGLKATWAFATHWYATFGLEYQSIPLITGDVTITGEMGRESYGGGGGMGMSAATLSLGAGYRF